MTEADKLMYDNIRFYLSRYKLSPLEIERIIDAFKDVIERAEECDSTSK